MALPDDPFQRRRFDGHLLVLQGTRDGRCGRVRFQPIHADDLGAPPERGLHLRKAVLEVRSPGQNEEERVLSSNLLAGVEQRSTHDRIQGMRLVQQENQRSFRRAKREPLSHRKRRPFTARTPGEPDERHLLRGQVLQSGGRKQLFRELRGSLQLRRRHLDHLHAGHGGEMFVHPSQQRRLPVPPRPVENDFRGRRYPLRHGTAPSPEERLLLLPSGQVGRRRSRPRLERPDQARLLALLRGGHRLGLRINHVVQYRRRLPRGRNRRGKPRLSPPGASTPGPATLTTDRSAEPALLVSRPGPGHAAAGHRSYGAGTCSRM